MQDSPPSQPPRSPQFAPFDPTDPWPAGVTAFVVFALLGLLVMLAILVVLRRRRMPMGYLFGVHVVVGTLVLGAATSLYLWRDWSAFDQRQRSSIDYMLARGAVLEAGDPSGTTDRYVKVRYPDGHKYAGSAATVRLWPYRYDWLAAWAPALVLGVVCGVLGCGLRVITDRRCRQRSHPPAAAPADAPPSLRALADFASDAVRLSLLEPSKVVAWADSLVADSEVPRPWLVELSMVDVADSGAVQSALRNVPGESAADQTHALLGALVLREWQRGQLPVARLRGIGWRIYRGTPACREDLRHWGLVIELEGEALEEGHITEAMMRETIERELAAFEAVKCQLPPWT